jgi:hypothetical protein
MSDDKTKIPTNPLNKVFNETILNFRCDFSCDENYEMEIMYAIYVHCVEGNPKYIKLFERLYLKNSSFRYKWLHICREKFELEKIYPSGWWSKSYFSSTNLSITDEWNAFTQTVFKCFMQYRKFSNTCSVKDTIPGWWFVIRPSTHQCPAEKYFCILRNSTLLNDLENGHIDSCLPAFPGDASDLILSRPKLRAQWAEEEQ